MLEGEFAVKGGYMSAFQTKNNMTTILEQYTDFAWLSK